MNEEVDFVKQFQNLLLDVIILKAKQKAIEGSYLNFVKKNYPDSFESIHAAFVAHAQRQGYSLLSEHPQFQNALSKKLKDELGL